MENEYKYHIEKVILSKELKDKLFMVFGREKGRAIRGVYIAIKILHQKYTDGNYTKFFYCSNRQIGDMALMSDKQAGLYVRVLQKLGLIFRLINPSQDIIIDNEGLSELTSKFYSEVNKKTTFIRVAIPTKEILNEAVLRSDNANKWLQGQSKRSIELKRTKRMLKKLELTMTAEEVDKAKTKGIQA